MNQVQKYAVLGSGSAGHAIAVLASQAGFAVQMYENAGMKYLLKSLSFGTTI